MNIIHLALPNMRHVVLINYVAMIEMKLFTIEK